MTGSSKFQAADHSIAGQTSAIRETKQLTSLPANVSDKLNGQQSGNSETLKVHEKFNV